MSWPSTALPIVVLYILLFLTVSINPFYTNFEFLQYLGLVGVILAFVHVLKHLPKKKDTYRNIILGLALFGMLLSAFMTYAHFNSADIVCTAGTDVPCDIINKSHESQILGVPVALIGLLGYIGLFLMTYFGYHHYTFYAALGGILFTVYLNYIQFFEYYTLCPFCETSALTIVLVAVFAYRLK